MTNTFPSNITPEALSELPRKQFEGRIIVADNSTSLQAALKLLENFEMLGFDTETKPAFKKGHSHKVAMLQLASNDTCFIFRLNKIGLPDELVKTLSNKHITKIGLALRDDFNALSKLKNLTPAGFIDLQKYTESFAIKDKSLKKLAAIILGIRISKSQQTSNWESPILTGPQLDYAATDAWICLEIYKRLKEVELKHGIIDKGGAEIR
jgi:ribonuclease D